MNYFDYEYRIRYADTDKMGISYYANYFVWFEAARTEYFRALGLPYTECEKKGIMLPVIRTGAHYHASCTYDDLIVVRTSVAEFKPSSMRFEYRTFKKGSEILLTTGFSIHVFVDKNMQPMRVLAEVKDLVTLFSVLDKKEKFA